MKPPYTYLLYGFNVKSDIEMPAVPGNAAQAGDLFFRLLPPTTKQPTTIGSNWLIESAAGQTSLTIRDVGTYRIRNGSEVYVEPVPAVENSRLRIYLMASVLGLLLDQRGLLVLHASAIQVGSEAALFLGESGFGKSTIAAAMSVKGYPIIADDLAPVQIIGSDACITPGFPRLKLYPEIASSLGMDTRKMQVLDNSETKRAHSVDDAFAAGTFPVRWIFVLSRSMQQDIARPVFQEAVMQLVRHSYPTRLGVNGGVKHFARCGEVAKRATTLRLKTFSTLAEISQITETIERQFDHSSEHEVARIGLWS